MKHKRQWQHRLHITPESLFEAENLAVAKVRAIHADSVGVPEQEVEFSADLERAFDEAQQQLDYTVAVDAQTPPCSIEMHYTGGFSEQERLAMALEAMRFMSDDATDEIVIRRIR